MHTSSSIRRVTDRVACPSSSGGKLAVTAAPPYTAHVSTAVKERKRLKKTGNTNETAKYSEINKQK